MRVLVATNRGQGRRGNDYTAAVPGELVIPADPCDRDGDDPDGGCGCLRAFVGLASGAATTTAEVVDMEDLDLDGYAQLIGDALNRFGWTVDADLAAEIAADVADVAAEFDPGVVVERRGEDTFQPRTGVPDG